MAGDFDSIRPEVKKYYEDIGVIVKHSKDQNSTDFMKCVRYTERYLLKEFDIVVLGGLGGRVDQSFHSLHHLYLSAFPPLEPSTEEGWDEYVISNIRDDPRDLTQVAQYVYLLSSMNMSFLLPQGESRIRTPNEYLGLTCGLIPLSGKSVISTKGLEWDVTDWPTWFGGRVSTSNHLVSDEVWIKTDRPLLFTVELRL